VSVSDGDRRKPRRLHAMRWRGGAGREVMRYWSVDSRSRLIAEEEHDVFNDTTRQWGAKYGRTNCRESTGPQATALITRRHKQKVFCATQWNIDDIMSFPSPGTRRSAEIPMSQVYH
jgi:hypothetical protein